MLDPSVILEEEIKSIEQSILEKTGNLPLQEKIENDKGELNEEPKIDAPQIEIDPSKKKKAEIIQDINELEARMNLPISDEKKLIRLTKNQLIKLLAETMNKSSGEGRENGENNIQDVNESLKPVNGDREYYAKTLTQLNYRLVNFCEALSIGFKDKTLGIELLAGWSQNVKSAETELHEIFLKIVDKYGVSIKQYLNPIVHYSMIMSSSAMLTIASNAQKKKKDSKVN